MTLSPGTRLGPYEIISLLGAGGMGEVFRARDSRLGRDVAVKVLPERLSSDTEAHARFEREAHAVAALSHPNIVALLDIGKSGETAIVVMELLNGETLRERLHSGPLPGRKAVETAREIAIGLAAAHEHGIVHRDLKPENVFLTRDGRVKLLDSGLAKDLVPLAPGATSAPTIAPTEPGTVMGTVGYMSPEQVRAKTRGDPPIARGPRSDRCRHVRRGASPRGRLRDALFRFTREREVEARHVMRLQIVPPNGVRLTYDWGRSFAISPDGTKLVYVMSKGASTELMLRVLDGEGSVPIPGTEGGSDPFFSPDGRWVAFAAGSKLKKVAVAGGTPLTLCDAPVFRGAVWATDNFIYYVPSIYSTVSRIAADGGTPQIVTKIRAADGEQQHRWPEVLPDAKHLLYVIGSGGEWDDATIVAERLPVFHETRSPC